jgi:hypothetical protein
VQEVQQGQQESVVFQDQLELLAQQVLKVQLAQMG